METGSLKDFRPVIRGMGQQVYFQIRQTLVLPSLPPYVGNGATIMGDVSVGL